MKKLDPSWNGSFVIGAGGLNDRASEQFRWERLPLPPSLLAQRAEVVGIALFVALAAALPFDRFDPARRRLGRRKSPARERADEAGEGAADAGRAAPSSSAQIHLPPLATARVHALAPLVGAELRIALRAMPRWWLLGAAVLAVGGVAAPNEARMGWLAAAFLWPALVWSGLATRDRATGVAPLLAATESPRARQLPALLLAGWLAGLFAIGGGALGFALHGESRRALAVLLGALAAPLLAIALGILSAGARLFEGLYIALWYVGPFQRTPPVDFAGVTPEGAASLVPLVYLGIGAALLVWALGVEVRRRLTGEARFV